MSKLAIFIFVIIPLVAIVLLAIAEAMSVSYAVMILPSLAIGVFLGWISNK